MAKKRNRKKSTRLEDTKAVYERTTRAEELEWERENIKIELEKLMSQYAKVSGKPELGARRYKVGKSANDYRFR